MAGDPVRLLRLAGRGVLPELGQADRQGAGLAVYVESQPERSALRINSTHDEVLDPARFSLPGRAIRVSNVDEAAETAEDRANSFLAEDEGEEFFYGIPGGGSDAASKEKH